MARDGSAPVAAVDDRVMHRQPTAVQPRRQAIHSRFDRSGSRRGGAARRTPALLLLAQNFGLSDFERDVLLLCAAVELDPR